MTARPLFVSPAPRVVTPRNGQTWQAPRVKWSVMTLGRLRIFGMHVSSPHPIKAMYRRGVVIDLTVEQATELHARLEEALANQEGTRQ